MKITSFIPLNFFRGLLLLSLCILSTIFLVQSCSDETEEVIPIERELARAALETDILYSLPTIEQLVNSKGEGLGQREIEAHLKNALSPAMYSAKKVLSTYGISEAFLKENFGSAEDPRIFTAALLLAESNTNSYKGNQAMMLPLLFQPSEEKEDWFDCAIRAVGIDAVMEMLNGRITEAIAKKAIKKIATRTLGWVGAAIAAYEFANCMGWT